MFFFSELFDNVIQLNLFGKIIQGWLVFFFLSIKHFILYHILNICVIYLYILCFF